MDGRIAAHACYKGRMRLLLVAMVLALAGCSLIVDVEGCGHDGVLCADGGPDAAPSVCIDGDGDGYGAGCARGADCDDADPGAFPGNPELCDGRDQNCDGRADESASEACYSGPAQTRGRGVCIGGARACGAEACVGEVVPRASDECDGADDDCDGHVDEDCACEDATTRDCYGGPAGTAGVGLCRGGGQRCAGGRFGECAGQVLPAAERCNGADDDCDGRTDEGLEACGCVPTAETCNAADDDCDGRADEHAGEERCNGADDDCDGKADEHAGEERCNQRDDDCDGRADEGLDRCACVPAAETCNGADDDCDGRADEHAVPEICNGADDDCDGRTDEHAVPEVCNGADDDCDGSADEHAAPEVCNGADDDCDGRADEAVTNACGGCGPVAAEVCNGADDDCDGASDEGLRNACGDCGPLPSEVCNERDDDCDGAIDEAVRNVCGRCGAVPEEDCNGSDDDCDGRIDEDLERACGHEGGGCRGIQRCRGGEWSECRGGESPDEEHCNGSDDDCDGRVDEDLARDCGSDVGACRPGRQVCNDGLWGVCGGELGPVPEGCNEVDDDCDGFVDEGVANACQACGAPPAEVCNDLDDDCDGQVDEGVRNPCFGCAAVPVEVCNVADDDCDGRIDEGFDLSSDILNCGSCGRRCIARRADACVDGVCVCGDSRPCFPGSTCLGGYCEPECDPICP